MNPGRLLLTARILAFAVSLPTFAVMVAEGTLHLGNLFFVPDVILCAALVVAAVLPARLARPGLVLAYAFAAGVVTAAVFAYVARGALDEGVLTVLVAVVCAAAAAALAFVRDGETAAIDRG